MLFFSITSSYNSFFFSFFLCEVEEFKEGRPEPAVTIPFPAKMFPNRLAPKVHNHLLKNPPFCYFALFLIVFAIPFSKKLECSRAWTIFIISFISSFETIKVVLEPCIFF